MADIYVDSNATGGSQTGADWTNAYLTLAAAAAVDNAGDTIWVASDHSETDATGKSYAWSGSVAAPTRIISADKTSGEPPSTTQAGALIAATGANGIIFNTAATVIYVFGITFESGSGDTGNQVVYVTNVGCAAVMENCTFRTLATGSGSNQGTGSSGANVVFKNCQFKFSNSAQNFMLNQALIFIDGGIESGSSAITLFADSLNQPSILALDGFDLSNAASSLDITNNDSNITVRLRNCKLPSSWSGSLMASSNPSRNYEFGMFNCSGSDVNYALNITATFGDVVHETTLVKSGGASDGTTSISWDMTTTADVEWSHQTLDSPEIVRWNERVGQPVKIAVDILHDSVTNLQNDEIWLEVQYLGTSGFPLSSFIDDAAATYTSTPADQETSSATWTTTGLTNPNEQQLSVIFTPQEAGYFIAKVKLAKASYTVYVDPRLQVGVG